MWAVHAYPISMTRKNSQPFKKLNHYLINKQICLLVFLPTDDPCRP